MKPVMQTVTGPRGNCQSACLASILGLSIENVPNFYDAGPDESDWHNALRAWLRGRGWGLVSVGFGEALWPARLEGWQIVWGPSARGLLHSTVWYGGKMVHDPHPEHTGLVKAEGADLLYPLDAASMQIVFGPATAVADGGADQSTPTIGGESTTDSVSRGEASNLHQPAHPHDRGVQLLRRAMANYCLILKALGMEEEGDPVAEVERLCNEPRNLGARTAADTLMNHGVFKGAHGLEGLLNAREFWDKQPYGTRLYYGDGIADYLHIGVLRAAVEALTPNG